MSIIYDYGKAAFFILFSYKLKSPSTLKYSLKGHKWALNHDSRMNKGISNIKPLNLIEYSRYETHRQYILHSFSNYRNFTALSLIPMFVLTRKIFFVQSKQSYCFVNPNFWNETKTTLKNEDRFDKSMDILLIYVWQKSHKNAAKQTNCKIIWWSNSNRKIKYNFFNPI